VQDKGLDQFIYSSNVVGLPSTLNELTTDSSGNMYFIGGDMIPVIYKVNTSFAVEWSVQVAAAGGASGLYKPYVSTVDIDNNLIFAAWDRSTQNKTALIKINANGTVAWSKQISYRAGSQDDEPYEVVTDPQGNIYMAGMVLDATGAYMANVAKYSSAGVHLWSNQIVNTTDSVFSGITIDSSNNVYVMGYVLFSGYKSVIVKYNSAGVRQWTKTFTGPTDVNYRCIISDPNGYVYACLRSSGGGAYLIKLDTAGNTVWAKTCSHEAISVGLDSSYNLWLTTRTFRYLVQIHFGGTVLNQYTISEPNGEIDWINIGGKRLIQNYIWILYGTVVFKISTTPGKLGPHYSTASFNSQGAVIPYTISRTNAYTLTAWSPTIATDPALTYASAAPISVNNSNFVVTNPSFTARASNPWRF
jgi:hypothetical protein